MKIGNQEIRVKHNENNRFWKPLGMFINTCEIKIDNEWYRFTPNFIKKDFKNYLQITHSMIVDDKTSVVKKFHENIIYKELPISIIKMNVIKFRINQHPLNYWIYHFIRGFHSRKNSIIVFSIAFIAAAAFYFLNVKFKNAPIDFVARNIWSQTVIMFLTVASFINIFYPFSLRKEINKNDVEDISKETIKKEKELQETMEKIKKFASF